MTPADMEKALEAARRLLDGVIDREGEDTSLVARALLSARASVVEECAAEADFMQSIGRGRETPAAIRSLNSK